MDYPVFSKRATLRFERQELLDDIKGLAYIEGDTMQQVDDEHAKHQVYDVCEPGNVELITRNMNTTFAKCVELCYPYAAIAVRPRTGRTNELEADDYVMNLKLPETFSETTITLLESLIHDILVARAMEKWMSLTKKESVARWREEAERIEPEIKLALNSRSRCFTRKMFP